LPLPAAAARLPTVYVIAIMWRLAASVSAAAAGCKAAARAWCEEWEVCPCGWRPELAKHYAKTGHVQWWREQIKERGSLKAVYREVRRRQREYGNRDVG
jgi:hypothetical protein